MAHGIGESDTVVVVGKPAWHGLESLVSALSPDDLRANEKFNYTVSCQPLFLAGASEPVSQVRAVQRDSDGSILGVVGPQWTPLQNSKLIDLFQPFVDTGMVKLETAGTLFDGQKVWLMGQVVNAEGDIVPGDQAQRRIMLSNSHDGKHAVRIGFADIRIVCANTLGAAHHSQASQLIRVRHTSQVEVNVERIRDVMDLSANEFRASMDQLRALSTKAINAYDLKKYVKFALAKLSNKPSPHKVAETPDAELNARFRGLVEKVLGHVESSPGSEYGRGTWYQAAQGVNYYANHVFGRTTESRVDNILFNNSGAKPFEWAMELAQSA